MASSAFYNIAKKCEKKYFCRSEAFLMPLMHLCPIAIVFISVVLWIFPEITIVI